MNETPEIQRPKASLRVTNFGGGSHEENQPLLAPTDDNPRDPSVGNAEDEESTEPQEVVKMPDITALSPDDAPGDDPWYLHHQNAGEYTDEKELLTPERLALASAAPPAEPPRRTNKREKVTAEDLEREARTFFAQKAARIAAVTQDNLLDMLDPEMPMFKQAVLDAIDTKAKANENIDQKVIELEGKASKNARASYDAENRKDLSNEAKLEDYRKIMSRWVVDSYDYSPQEWNQFVDAAERMGLNLKKVQKLIKDPYDERFSQAMDEVSMAFFKQYLNGKSDIEALRKTYFSNNIKANRNRGVSLQMMRQDLELVGGLLGVLGQEGQRAVFVDISAAELLLQTPDVFKAAVSDDILDISKDVQRAKGYQALLEANKKPRQPDNITVDLGKENSISSNFQIEQGLSPTERAFVKDYKLINEKLLNILGDGELTEEEKITYIKEFLESKYLRKQDGFTIDGNLLYDSLVKAATTDGHKGVERFAQMIFITSKAKGDKEAQVKLSEDLRRLLGGKGKDVSLRIIQEVPPTRDILENISAIDGFVEYMQRHPAEVSENIAAYKQALDAVLEKLPTENGGVVEIRGDIPTVVVPDVHARPTMVSYILRQETNIIADDGHKLSVFELLQQGKINLVFLGDLVHSEKGERWNLEQYPAGLLYEVDENGQIDRSKLTEYGKLYEKLNQTKEKVEIDILVAELPKIFQPTNEGRETANTIAGNRDIIAKMYKLSKKYLYLGRVDFNDPEAREVTDYLRQRGISLDWRKILFPTVTNTPDVRAHKDVVAVQEEMDRKLKTMRQDGSYVAIENKLMEAEMRDAMAVMMLVWSLKSRFSNNVQIIAGTHDNIAGKRYSQSQKKVVSSDETQESGGGDALKFNVNQTWEMRRWVVNKLGRDIFTKWSEYFDKLPLVVTTPDRTFLASHTTPGTTVFTRDQIVGQDIKAVHEFIWDREFQSDPDKAGTIVEQNAANIGVTRGRWYIGHTPVTGDIYLRQDIDQLSIIRADAEEQYPYMIHVPGRDFDDNRDILYITP